MLSLWLVCFVCFLSNQSAFFCLFLLYVVVKLSDQIWSSPRRERISVEISNGGREKRKRESVDGRSFLPRLFFFFVLSGDG